eukprot:3530449-Rhodomonas_salina.2
MVACSSLNEASAQAAAGVADIEPGDELTHIDDVQVSDASMVIVQDAIQVPLLILISGRACCTLHGSEVTPCGPSCQGPQGTEVKLSFKKENGQVYHTSLARGPGFTATVVAACTTGCIALPRCCYLHLRGSHAPPSTGSGSGGDPEQGGPPLGSDVLSTDEPPASAGALASSDNPPPQKKTPKRRVVQGGGDSAFRVPTHQERDWSAGREPGTASRGGTWKQSEWLWAGSVRRMRHVEPGHQRDNSKK